MFFIDLRECTSNTNTRSKLTAATSTLPNLADGNYTCHRNDPYKENYRNGQSIATQDRVFPHYVSNSSIKHSKSDSKDRSQEIL
jgi:hypothetical protein